ncbi:ribonuclease H-like domain-containing protein [Tanacetum coccineum]
MTGETPPPSQPKQPIDKAYSIASIKACIPTPLDLDKLNYNSWSALFQRFCRTYEVHHHLEAPPTTTPSTIDLLHETNDSSSLLHASSSSPTVLVASTTPHDKANTMSTSGFDVCRNFQRGSCSYESRCMFVHGENDLRPRPPTTGSTAQGRAQSNSMSRPSQVVPHMASKTTTSNTNRTSGASVVAQCQSTQPVYSDPSSTNPYGLCLL